MEVFIRRYFLLVVFSLQASCSLALCQAFFTPQDNLTSIFVDMINAEQKSIHGAIYMFTDKKITQAFINAKSRGVEVVLVLDQISMASCGKGKLLQEGGISVIIHRTEGFNPYTMALMHHKFFIFGCNKDSKSLLWTGSWNCTVRGTQYNDENVIVLDDSKVIKSYLDYFLKLQKKLIE